MELISKAHPKSLHCTQNLQTNEKQLHHQILPEVQKQFRVQSRIIYLRDSIILPGVGHAMWADVPGEWLCNGIEFQSCEMNTF